MSCAAIVACPDASSRGLRLEPATPQHQQANRFIIGEGRLLRGLHGAALAACSHSRHAMLRRSGKMERLHQILALYAGKNAAQDARSIAGGDADNLRFSNELIQNSRRHACCGNCGCGGGICRNRR